MKKVLKMFSVLLMLALLLTGCGSEEKDVTGTWVANYVDTTFNQMVPIEGDFEILVSLELKEDQAYVLSMTVSDETLVILKTGINTIVDEQIVAVMEQANMTKDEAIKYLEGGEEGKTIEQMVDENLDMIVDMIASEVLEGTWEQTSEGIIFDEEEDVTLTWDGDALTAADFVSGISLTFSKE